MSTATITNTVFAREKNRKYRPKAAHALTPVNNAVILPLFAFVSALVIIPEVPLTELSPAFWGITIALPFGKLVGITLAGTLVAWFITRKAGKNARQARQTLVTGWDLITVAAVSGIGFTVSLLMTELAFANDEALRDEGVLAVLSGSAIAILLGTVFVVLRARHYRVK